MPWVQIKPGLHHTLDYHGGDVIEVTDAELQAFGDKFTLPQEPDATDSARALALESGISLFTVTGTGAGGRIIKTDVEAVLDDNTQ